MFVVLPQLNAFPGGEFRRCCCCPRPLSEAQLVPYKFPSSSLSSPLSFFFILFSLWYVNTHISLPFMPSHLAHALHHPAYTLCIPAHTSSSVFVALTISLDLSSRFLSLTRRVVVLFFLLDACL